MSTSQKAQSQIQKGLARAKAGDWDGAERAFTDAISLFPEEWEAYVNRGNVHQERGDLDAAITDFSRAISMRPGDVAPHFNRGNARSLAGDLSGAVADYTEAIRIDAKFARGFERRGLVLQRLGQEERAEHDFSRAIHLSPDRAEAWGMRATLRALRGATEAALEDCERALGLLPAHSRQREAMQRFARTLRGDGRDTKGASARTEEKMAPKKRTAKPKKKSPAGRGKGSKSGKKTSRGRRGEDVILATFSEAGLSPARTQEPGGTVRFDVLAEEGDEIIVTARLFPKDSRFVVYLSFVRPAPKKTRNEVAEFMTRANAGLVSGNFECRLEDGSARFKTAIDYRDTELETTHVRNMILHAMDAVETYGEGLLEVIDGRRKAARAVRDAES